MKRHYSCFRGLLNGDWNGTVLSVVNAPHRTIRIAMAGWMSLVVLCSGVSGMVLCIGADGHVALESDHAGHCHPHEHDSQHEDPHNERACADLDLTAAGCVGDDCVDVGLASEGVLPLVQKGRFGTRNGSSFSPLTLSQHVASLPALRDARPGSHYLDTGGHASALKAQRTVVLRI